MKTKSFLMTLATVIVLLGCSSSKNFLGVQEEPKKVAPRPSNPSVGQPQNAADVLAKEPEKTTPKILRSYVEDQNYTQAIKEFQAALSQNPDAADINFYTAESYRKLGDLRASTPYYEKAIAGGFEDEELELNYAQALKASEEYDKAREVLSNYLTYASLEIYRDRAQRELANLTKLDSISLYVRDVDLKPLESINSDQSEYSPFFYNNKLYFVSTREATTFQRYGLPFSDIFSVDLDGLSPKAETLSKLPDLFNSANINEGPIAFSPDGNTVVFAKGNPEGKKERRSVDLYVATKRNGEWSTPAPMPINNPLAWDTSPAFNQSGTTIYFASDRPGGYGGSDIYRATINARGRWADVTNMGPDINTAGDEVFPYVSPDNKLYFASNGHAGFGMLDLFVAENKGGVITVKNMGPSFNSSSDDFGLVYSDFPFEGFFSSNRPGGSGGDDIYSFVDNSSDLKTITYTLKGTTYRINEDSTQSILGDVRVKLLDENEQLVDDVLSSRGGSYSFKIDPEKNYTIIGEKQDYFTARKFFSTVGEGIPQEDLVERFNEKVFNEDIALDPIILEKAIVLQNIYYDLNRAEIRSDAAVELDKLVQILKDNPNIRIELSSHTDARSDDDYNLDLSQRRAQAAVDYIVSKGISADRLIAKGYGESQLVNGCTNERIDECTEEEHQQNRRTEFKVIEYERN
ncbi:OmpA family protein [Roseivirga sp. UBA1976]|jgi:outer membrane protein OmpA-like peptidoglycan-associated protein|uniref:OmpA family protein n=1 Tax=Roseivirga sp. UBA1976 TaxID=1947386 RepID=UPI00257DA80C|nr:OmpA family protein [Roseivirga sp. UBA1976]MEC7752855.1 OmpA family protein [Bacteroidota bacterium]|tara:strand:- start:694 stop:2760 length:2067 start_codon:yes stop_codon:yes gene_type:complete